VRERQTPDTQLRIGMLRCAPGNLETSGADA
jgi:hypothetical protein